MLKPSYYYFLYMKFNIIFKQAFKIQPRISLYSSGSVAFFVKGKMSIIQANMPDLWKIQSGFKDNISNSDAHILQSSVHLNIKMEIIVQRAKFTIKQ